MRAQSAALAADNAIRVHDQSAAEYDHYAIDYGYFIPDALFGLCFEYLQPHQRLLDIGIGTGLSALPFVNAGLQVFGIDGSAEMLVICKSKNLPIPLKQFDIRERPWPYPDGTFDHALACGVFHFIPDLAPVFQEIARLVRSGGTFTFTAKAPFKTIRRNYTTEMIGGVQIYSHRSQHLAELSSGCGFHKVKELRFVLSRGPGQADDVYCAWVTKKN